jgi:hypothetical protein
MARPRRPVGMLDLRRADIGDGGNHLPGHTNSLAGLVSCHVVGDDAKEWCERYGIAAGSRSEEL